MSSLRKLTSLREPGEMGDTNTKVAWLRGHHLKVMPGPVSQVFLLCSSDCFPLVSLVIHEPDSFQSKSAPSTSARAAANKDINLEIRREAEGLKP